ncbi:MAG TPA: glycosyltransferase, partial [Acholeplasma sp.]|nr:glycosyltransferase [Acholeplasma sp.]
MKKILITQSDLTIGGIQKSLINLLNQLDYRKYKVDLVLFEKKGELLNEVPSEVNIISIKEKYNLTLSKKERILKEVFSYKSFFNKLYKNLKDETRYDVAIAFDGYVSFSDYYAAFSNAKKKVIWVHSDFYSRKKFQFKFKIKLFSLKDKYQYFDQIVAVSNSAKEGFIKVFPKNKEKTTYIWNFMEEPKKDFLIEKPDVIFNKNYFNIISIGALLPVKGYERLIKVHAKLNKNGFNIKMYILGDGQRRKKLEKLITRNNLEDSFILLGRRKNVYPILKQADLFVSSSYYEGFGVVLLESLSLGVPILVPRIS